MISINDAINSGAWLHCELNNLTQFNIKVISFRKINLSEIDEPEKINLYDSNTTLWMMQLEIVNLTKEAISPEIGPGKIILIDQEGFKFKVFKDNHLRFSSVFAEKSKMKRFYSYIELVPKIKAFGALPFQLPNDDGAEYSISIQIGNIVEI